MITDTDPRRERAEEAEESEVAPDEATPKQKTPSIATTRGKRSARPPVKLGDYVPK